MGPNVGYFNKANQRYSFFYSILKKLPQKKDIRSKTRNAKLFIVVQQTPSIFLFFNSIQNSHVHENLQHLYITTEKNLTSNRCLKLKSLGFSVLKYIILPFC